MYPGRLYVEDLPAFVDSLDRLVAWTETRPVSAVVGCHIELSTTPGRDPPIGYPYHPDEPPLAMTVEQLRHLRDVARTLPDRPAVTDAGDAIVWVGRPLGAVTRAPACCGGDRDLEPFSSPPQRPPIINDTLSKAQTTHFGQRGITVDHEDLLSE